MRRGRPVKADGDVRNPKPSPSPLRGVSNDPWAALDPGSEPVQNIGSLDDASIRFPALDDFSLLHDSGNKFAFDPNRKPQKQPSRDISQRVTDALADDAFAQFKASSQPIQPQPSPNPQLPETKPKHISVSSTKSESTPKISTQQDILQRPQMVSTGTMTSPTPPSPKLQSIAAASRPIFRIPSNSRDHRPSSQPRAPDGSELAASTLRSESIGQKRPPFLEQRSRSQILTTDVSQPSRPSLEINHRSSYLGAEDGAVHRSRSANSRTRPTSVQAPSKPNLLRRLSREKSKTEESKLEFLNTPLISTSTSDPNDTDEAIKIDSNVDYLKAMEEEDASKRKDKRLSSGSKHIKRASMPSVSLSGTKNLLTGRFGDAFKRFETNGSAAEPMRDSSQSPNRGASGLTPIAGSEATDGRSDDGQDLEESEEIPPEMRRELERRRLSQEEKRVADAAAAYRQRLAQGGESGRARTGGGSTNNKAISIQSKVKTLLDESGRASPSPTKTASGYGRFTDLGASEQPKQDFPARTTSRQPPSFNAIKPQQTPSTQPSSNATVTLPKTSTQISQPVPPHSLPHTDLPRHSAPPTERPFNRPSAPPKPQTKPQNLRTGDRLPQSPAKPASLTSRKPLPQRLQQEPPPPPQQQPPPSKTDGADEDWESNFSKRYPDLAGLEMVETELDGGGSLTNARRPPTREVRIRDV